MSVATGFSTAGVLAAADPRRLQPAAGEMILVVEDDENVRHLVAAALRRRGYRVLEAAAPSEAMHISSDRGTPIHLVLSDVMLPEMDGRRLTNALRQARPEIKVLLMTGSPDETLHQLDIVREEVLSPRSGQFPGVSVVSGEVSAARGDDHRRLGRVIRAGVVGCSTDPRRRPVATSPGSP